MSARSRKALGLLAFVVGLPAYALLAMRLGLALPATTPVEFVYYALAGIAWFYPAARLVRWMQARDYPS